VLYHLREACLTTQRLRAPVEAGNAGAR